MLHDIKRTPGGEGNQSKPLLLCVFTRFENRSNLLRLCDSGLSSPRCECNQIVKIDDHPKALYYLLTETELTLVAV